MTNFAAQFSLDIVIHLVLLIESTILSSSGVFLNYMEYIWSGIDIRQKRAKAVPYRLLLVVRMSSVRTLLLDISVSIICFIGAVISSVSFVYFLENLYIYAFYHF